MMLQHNKYTTNLSVFALYIYNIGLPLSSEDVGIVSIQYENEVIHESENERENES